MAKQTISSKGKKKPPVAPTIAQGRIPLNDQEKETLIILGQKIREKRNNTFKRNTQNIQSARSMNQGTLATYINATGPHLSKIENGQVEIGIIKLMSLAYALGTDPSELLQDAWQYFKTTKIPENK